MTVYFLGGGNMAEAIIAGLRRARPVLPVHVADRGEEKRRRLAQQYRVAVSEKLPVPTADDVLVLAVKPQDMQTACAGVETGGALVLSVAAGLSTATLSRYLNGHTRIIRVMPNTPSKIGLGVSGLFAPEYIGQTDRDTAEMLMRPAGMTIWLDDENRMHRITGISGSGSAYVFYLLDALAAAAREQGFSAQDARSLSLATFKGAVALAEAQTEDFSVLQQQVTSKGGTTAEAVKVFEARDIAGSIAQGVAACVRRSEEIAAVFEKTPSEAV
ncbi:pyrroline-5-carboxylate reductase [Neisseria leonii]|uniref:Pyrroline-5-carboxylate reductase n=1 Tax=Neisseria leonii TaxID=2995413 RepID=A0A9X4IEF7_9NEIS|nr:pyrroline-5-carboxylate reductase [Neisseria sp. 51.81]MDD9328721.1 pyrroline-5-carboxylate reductase [Neisseria sp. 51.81]